MRRLIMITCLLGLSWYCFAQQNLPGKIIGRIPDPYSTQKYEIQVGAFGNERNVEQALAQLRRNALNPISEPYQQLTRVMIRGVPAAQVINFLTIIKQAGFNEVIIREFTVISLAEKWEINSPDSDYTSFEFNDDLNYIAIASDDRVRFGGYTMPNRETINMDNLGVVHITGYDNGIHFTFAPTDDPDNIIQMAALKTEAMPPSRELDLFCRTWKVVYCTNTDSIGHYLFISNTGTYFFTTADGVANSLSSWRWYGNDHKEFEYSHDNWEHYGRAQVTTLTQFFLGMFDPGFNTTIPGYSKADVNNTWELIPVKD